MERKRRLADLDGEAMARRVAQCAQRSTGLVPGLIVDDMCTLRRYRLHDVSIPESAWSRERSRVVVCEIDVDTGLDLRWEPNPDDDDDYWPSYSDELSNADTVFRWHQATLDPWIGLDGPPFLDAPTEADDGVDATQCDLCGIFFEENFVVDQYDIEIGQRMFKIDKHGDLEEPATMCLRCAEYHPCGREFWKFVRLRLLLKSVAFFWNSCAHRPRYLHRLVAEANVALNSPANIDQGLITL